MIKIAYRLFIALILLALVSIIYLSTIGVKTDKFNNKLSSQIKKIDNNLEIRLKQIKITLNPFKLKINAKTIGPDLIYRDKNIQLESIKSEISLKALIEGKFSLTKVNISSKPLDIKSLFSFIHLLKKDPKIYIVKQFIKEGHIIADMEIEFDELGNIKNTFKVNGLVKNGKISLLKKFDLDKIEFIFNIQKDKFRFNDLKLLVNEKIILVPEIIATEETNKFLISGKVNNENLFINKKDINYFFQKDLFDLNIQEINFDSKSDFNFKIDKKLKISNLNINSEINLLNLKLQNSFKVKKIFPKIKKEILLQNHQIKLRYNKDNLNLIGSGDALLQSEYDKIEYEIFKNKNVTEYNATYKITKNLFKLDLLNYQKSEKSDLKINIKAKKENNKDLIFEEISLKEKDNILYIKDLSLSNDYKVNHIGNFKLNYKDKENFENNIRLIKKNKNYEVQGTSFNINRIIENTLDSDDKNKLDFFNNNFKLDLNIKKIYLDENNIVNDLKGYLFFNNNKVSELNLTSKFSNQKNIRLTVKSNGDEQITTLFSNEAKPLVDRYKFIKGFNEGSLDFYSIKKNNNSKSTLKMYDFKLKELPALTKILTLASLQGIADLLSGEGMRFNEFEMNFSNKDNLMTINEIYAIGPAISILMSGYIEKNKTISLRGTLVPATTINKTIGSIPILGNILVGKKAGEGVFGVSFKIKGRPKDLQTTVNPIKTLTPRFITRTLEKIKKN